jgi:hypothetical protein
MSDQAAAIAFAKLKENPGDTNARAKLVRWLLNDPQIGPRLDEREADWLVCATAQSSVGAVEKVLADLKSGLYRTPATILVALFRYPVVRRQWNFGPVRFGPVEEILDEHLHPAEGSWGRPAELASLAIRVEDPAIGIRGSRRALEWLRAGLGAVYLAGRIAGGGIDARLGPIPADELAPAMFVGPDSGLKAVVDVMRVPSTIPLEVDLLLGSNDAAELVNDCLQPHPYDLVQNRLRQAAPWIQCAFDALTFSEAVLSLGVALEALIGSEGTTTDVVRTVSMRVAFLLREGDTRQARALSASDWRTIAKDLYSSRSTVAHGRYKFGTLQSAKENEIRHKFEDVVCRVAKKFREEGKACRWLTDEDLKNWQDDMELS